MPRKDKNQRPRLKKKKVNMETDAHQNQGLSCTCKSCSKCHYHRPQHSHNLSSNRSNQIPICGTEKSRWGVSKNGGEKKNKKKFSEQTEWTGPVRREEKAVTHTNSTQGQE